MMYTVWWPDGGESGPEQGKVIDAYSFLSAARMRARAIDKGSPADEFTVWNLFVKDAFETQEISLVKRYETRYDLLEDHT